MKSFFWVLVLSAVIWKVTAIENKKPTIQKSIKELGEEIRDRRNLEYSLNLPHSHVASFRSLERRISNTPSYEVPQNSPGLLYQGRTGYGLMRKSRPSLPAPSYAVQMEPMVQYSQKDPLYDGSQDNIEEVINRNEIQAQPKILNVGDQISDNNIGNHVFASPHGGHGIPHHGPLYSPLVVPYYEHPEPIIEIIIKESNESLPAPPPIAAPLLKPRQKEPVQVFYVKYQQDPHGNGKDVIYDAPIPAITPPSNHESDHHEEYTTVPPEFLTLAPPPSTTLRAIIKPDSEDYHSDSGIRISFGTEAKSHSYHETLSEGHEESAPHISVAHPQQPLVKESKIPPPHFQKRQQSSNRDQQQFQQTQHFQQNFQTQHFQDNRNQHAQQRIQFQQPFPQNYQQLPLVNTPNQPFRPPQSQFSRPTSPVFSNPTLVSQNSASLPPHGPPQGPPRGPQQGIPQGPPFVIPPHRPLPSFPPQGPPHLNSRPPPSFSQRPEFPPSASSPHRNPFAQQRPFNQGPPPQQLLFNEHEYLQQNYHTITTEQLEPQQHLPREQQLPIKPAQNFVESPRKPIQAPIPISQQEYNQRYLEQVRLLQQQQERNRPRPQQNLGLQQPSVKFQQSNQPPIKAAPIPINQNLHPKPAQISLDQNFNQQLNIPQQPFHQPQNLRPQPPLPNQPPQFKPDNVASQFVPPGGELIASIPKYEQHLLIHPGQQPQLQTPQQSQIIQSQSFPQASPLIQERPQHVSQQSSQSQQIQQQFSVNNRNQQHQQSPSTSELISAYEENQREIQKLQERLRKSEEEQKQLIALSNQEKAQQTAQVNIHNEQYFTLKNQGQKNYPTSNGNQGIEIQGRNPQQEQYVAHKTNRPPLVSSTPRPKIASSTSRYASSTANSITDAPEQQKKEKTKKPIDFELPDEVPDDLRQQLLSSGILENAQISVLDYDKVGDIPLDSLPPEQLANFYGAGGGLQISGSAPVAQIVTPNGEKVKSLKSIDDIEEDDVEAAGSESAETIVDVYGKKKEVEMKVVHFDPSTVKGQQVAGKYVQEDAKRVEPVSLNDHKYNRYLPLKVNGAHFPLPDVPELKGRKVTSVVVLAPVDYDFAKAEKDAGGRSERAAPNKSKGINFVAGDALKRLVKTPTVENYKKWLEKEKSTSPDLQSVVLLVTGTDDGIEKDKEIFMYDVSTQTVSKLSGELSSAFVEVAETNAHSKDLDQIAVSDSGVVESAIKLVPEPVQSKPVQKPLQKDTKHNNHKPVFAEIETKKQIAAEKKEQKAKIERSSQELNSSEIKSMFEVSEESADKPINQVLISSGYSRMKLGRNLRREE